MAFAPVPLTLALPERLAPGCESLGLGDVDTEPERAGEAEGCRGVPDCDAVMRVDRDTEADPVKVLSPVPHAELEALLEALAEAVLVVQGVAEFVAEGHLLALPLPVADRGAVAVPPKDRLHVALAHSKGVLVALCDSLVLPVAFGEVLGEAVGENDLRGEVDVETEPVRVVEALLLREGEGELVGVRVRGGEGVVEGQGDVEREPGALRDAEGDQEGQGEAVAVRHREGLPVELTEGKGDRLSVPETEAEAVTEMDLVEFPEALDDPLTVAVALAPVVTELVREPFTLSVAMPDTEGLLVAVSEGNVDRLADREGEKERVAEAEREPETLPETLPVTLLSEETVEQGEEVKEGSGERELVEQGVWVAEGSEDRVAELLCCPLRVIEIEGQALTEAALLRVGSGEPETKPVPETCVLPVGEEAAEVEMDAATEAELHSDCVGMGEEEGVGHSPVFVCV